LSFFDKSTAIVCPVPVFEKPSRNRYLGVGTEVSIPDSMPAQIDFKENIAAEIATKDSQIYGGEYSI